MKNSIWIQWSYLQKLVKNPSNVYVGYDTSGEKNEWLFLFLIIWSGNNFTFRYHIVAVKTTENITDWFKFGRSQILDLANIVYWKLFLFYKMSILHTFVVGLNKFLDYISVLVRNEQNFLEFAPKNEMVKNICERRTISNWKKTFRTLESNRK